MEKLPAVLGHRFTEVKNAIESVEADEEDLARRLLDEAPHLLEAYQNTCENAKDSLAFLGEMAIKRLIIEFPEEFLDGKMFNQPYVNLEIGSESTRERLRKDSLDRIVSYFSDVVILLHGGKPQNKQELLRHSNTLSLFEGLFVI